MENDERDLLRRKRLTLQGFSACDFFKSNMEAFAAALAKFNTAPAPPMLDAEREAAQLLRRVMGKAQ